MNCRKDIMEVRAQVHSRRLIAVTIHNALIVADLSNDATYAEMLFEMFGAACDWSPDQSLWQWHGLLSGRPVRT